MTQFVVRRDAEVIQFTSQKLGVPLAPSIIAFGVVENNLAGPIIGGVVLSEWTGTNIYVTIWMPGLLRRHLIRDCYRYVFGHLDCLRLSARSRRDNVTMRKLYKRLGFEFEGTQKRYYGPDRRDDALQFVLMREAAQPWMR